MTKQKTKFLKTQIDPLFDFVFLYAEKKQLFPLFLFSICYLIPISETKIKFKKDTPTLGEVVCGFAKMQCFFFQNTQVNFIFFQSFPIVAFV